MIDLFYDHFLVKEWRNWSDDPFADYLVRTRSIITTYHDELPERLQKLVPTIFEELLPSYGEVSGIRRALERMSRRVVRSNPLAGGETELERHFDDLRTDFRIFMPLVRLFSEETMSADLIETRPGGNSR
jgi:acyl carrier protein phosphodiesterase